MTASVTDPMHDAVRPIRAPNPSPMTLDGTVTYIVGHRRPVVIDPGPAIARHLDQILNALGGAPPVAIVLTHSHLDHSEGAARLARVTGAPIWMGRGAIGEHRPLPPVDYSPHGSETLETDAGPLRIVPTPGHAPEHISVHWSPSDPSAGDAVFVGDLMMGQGDTALVAPPEGDLAAYLDSLKKIEEMQAEVLYPAHGGPILDPANAVKRYRDHRMQRIDQVRAALAENVSIGINELVERVYGPTLDPRLARAAAGSLQAVLNYLRRPT